MLSDQDANRLRVPGMTGYVLFKAGLARRQPSSDREDGLVLTTASWTLWRRPLDRLLPALDALVEAYVAGRTDDLGGLLELGMEPAQAERLGGLFFEGCDAAVAEMGMMPGLPDR